MIVVPFTHQHLRQIEVRHAQRDEYQAGLNAPMWLGDGRSVLDGERVLCAGVITPWPGRGVCWAIFGEVTLRETVFIHNEVMDFLAEQPHSRLETTVRSDFDAGRVWALKCGFQPEGLLRKYGPHGEDFQMYARIRC